MRPNLTVLPVPTNSTSYKLVIFNFLPIKIVFLGEINAFYQKTSKSQHRVSILTPCPHLPPLKFVFKMFPINPPSIPTVKNFRARPGKYSFRLFSPKILPISAIFAHFRFISGLKFRHFFFLNIPQTPTKFQPSTINGSKDSQKASTDILIGPL